MRQNNITCAKETEGIYIHFFSSYGDKIMYDTCMADVGYDGL